MVSVGHNNGHSVRIVESDLVQLQGYPFASYASISLILRCSAFFCVFMLFLRFSVFCHFTKSGDQHVTSRNICKNRIDRIKKIISQPTTKPFSNKDPNHPDIRDTSKQRTKKRKKHKRARKSKKWQEKAEGLICFWCTALESSSIAAPGCSTILHPPGSARQKDI